MKKVTTSLASVVILCRQLDRTLGFYSEVLGLKVVRQSPGFAELADCHNNSFVLRHFAGNQAALCKGYTPMLSFNVADFDSVLDKLRHNEVHIDGEPIVVGQQYKVVTFRGPEGEMLTIRQTEEETNSETDSQAEKADPTTEEIKKLLQKIKM